MQCTITLLTAASGVSSSPLSFNDGSTSSGKQSPFADLQQQQQAWSAGVFYPADPAPPPPLFLRIRTKPAEAALHGPVIVTAGSPCSSDKSSNSDKSSSSLAIRAGGRLLSHLSGRNTAICTTTSILLPKLAIKVPPSTSPAGATPSPARDTPPRLFLGCLPRLMRSSKARAPLLVNCDAPAPTTKPTVIVTTSSRKQRGITSLRALFTSFKLGRAAAASPTPTTDAEGPTLETFSSALSSMSSMDLFYSLPSSPPLSRCTSLDEAEGLQASHSVTKLEPTAPASAAGNSSNTAAAAAAAAPRAAAGPNTACVGWPSPNVPRACTCVDLSPQLASLRVSRPAIGCLLCGALMVHTQEC